MFVESDGQTYAAVISKLTLQNHLIVEPLSRQEEKCISCNRAVPLPLFICSDIDLCQAFSEIRTRRQQQQQQQHHHISQQPAGQDQLQWRVMANHETMVDCDRGNGNTNIADLMPFFGGGLKSPMKSHLHRELSVSTQPRTHYRTPGSRMGQMSMAPTPMSPSANPFDCPGCDSPREPSAQGLSHIRYHHNHGPQPQQHQQAQSYRRDGRRRGRGGSQWRGSRKHKRRLLNKRGVHSSLMPCNSMYPVNVGNPAISPRQQGHFPIRYVPFQDRESDLRDPFGLDVV
eukprot:Blabericola_migrator_1__2344@NODE_1654_length_4074_cov_86_070127_g1077_i0_p2_GENE_NODE_1654_length_4074_cov_86_070127_g1077_i0NODE_1654_length_4074_cov_86_070127_g1077_i0_p2_ORF_typecomplete_len286_score12_12ANAPC_CDC26/PF10471_9/0_18ANAPC_CDC26/PF10471_9/2_2e02Androgen_recep/PF02166_16/0_56Androgen_recep/PF02166_16/3_8e02_NODE_1654_length_4074_cov_86_070127_g1077_i020962953